MRYIIFIILFLTCSPLSSWAQDDPARRYRVELIVLQHLTHDELPSERKWVEDYSEALDFLSPPEDQEAEADRGSPTGAEPAMPPTAGGDALQPLTAADGDASPASGEVDDEPGNRVEYLPELGPEMQEAWRRLRLSGPFRPLQQLAWVQDGSAPFPLLRVHDRELILEQDPWADQRAAAGEGLQDAPDDPLQPDLPSPRRFYRLDGTAQLSRSRFLHLGLDIAWREPVFGSEPKRAPLSSDLAPDASQPPIPESFLVHRLQQRRQVRTDRMEYFDGPVLGVLARISRVAVDETEPTLAPQDAWTD